LEKFKSFITEETKPYKLVVFNNTQESVRDVGDSDRVNYELINKYAKKLGLEIMNVEHTGFYISEKDGKMFFNSFDFAEDGEAIKPTEDGKTTYQKPFQVDSENTLILPRGLGTYGYTANRRWVDLIKILEDRSFKTIPSIESWNICSSKYYCDQLFRANGLRTPKTIPLSYSDDSERVVKENNLKFPLILKSSSGSQTGVGVVILESFRSLHPTVQMITFLEPNIDLLLQEYIKIEYDIRVLVVNGKVLGAMKRNVMDGDIRSNASLGATTEFMELTDKEIESSLKAAELVKGDIVGVDLLPAKDREKEQPYVLEANATPGFGGIEKITKGKSITQEILKIFMNRDNWRIT
jgi:RimK family alpha-L-glutamate ligase